MANSKLDFIAKTSTFVMDDHGTTANTNEKYWSFTTRANGTVGTEQYGELDYQAAVELQKKVKELGFDAEIETVDEWVCLTVYEKIEKADPVEITLNELAAELKITPPALRRFLRKKGFEKPGNRWIWNDQEEVNRIKNKF